MTRPPVECTACGSSNVRSLFTASNIPVHSVVLMNTEEHARTFPRTDLVAGKGKISFRLIS